MSARITIPSEMEGAFIAAQQKAQFKASMVMVRHVADECQSEDLGKDIYRELVKVCEQVRKKFNLPVRRD